MGALCCCFHRTGQLPASSEEHQPFSTPSVAVPCQSHVVDINLEVLTSCTPLALPVIPRVVSGGPQTPAGTREGRNTKGEAAVETINANLEASIPPVARSPPAVPFLLHRNPASAEISLEVEGSAQTSLGIQEVLKHVNPGSTEDEAAVQIRNADLDTLVPDSSTRDIGVVVGAIAGGCAESLKKDLKETQKNLKGTKGKLQFDAELESTKDIELELEKSVESEFLIIEEEEECPICLEDYIVDNPKIVAQCEHHFHLSCILEWMERSGECPMCNQVAIF
ncbi:hypothetical protein Dimus_008661 [Dionaea muscipula]